MREASVYCELVPGTTPWSELKKREPAGLILSGGPASVYEAGAPQVDPEALRAGIPVLGICYGMQLIAHHLGGKVDPGHAREYGPALLAVREPNALFQGLNAELPVWMSQTTKVKNESTITIGTNTPEIASASFCTGAFFVCASVTRRTICASTVSLAALTILTISAPCWLTVAP